MAGCSRTDPSAFFWVLLFTLFGLSAAREFLVGGKPDAWKVPSPPGSDPLNKWAERTRFQVGDHLVWKYDGGKDSVLLVSKEGYDNCSTSNPIKQYNDGNTNVELDRPGPFFFISGAKGHCEQGERLIVVVLTPRGGGKHPGGVPPAPSPAPGFEGPAPAPAPSNGATALKGGGLVMMALVVLPVWVFFM